MAEMTEREELVKKIYSERGYMVFASRIEKEIGHRFNVDADDADFIREIPWKVVAVADKKEFRDALISYGIRPWIDSSCEFSHFYRCEAMD